MFRDLQSPMLLPRFQGPGACHPPHGKGWGLPVFQGDQPRFSPPFPPLSPGVSFQLLSQPIASWVQAGANRRSPCGQPPCGSAGLAPSLGLVANAPGHAPPEPGQAWVLPLGNGVCKSRPSWAWCVALSSGGARVLEGSRAGGHFKGNTPQSVQSLRWDSQR